MAALVTTGISTRNLIPTSEYDNASLQHMLTLDSQERLNDSEIAIIKCVWEGNITEIENLLATTPTLTKVKFSATVISQFCTSQERHSIKEASLLHLALFNTNKQIAKLLIIKDPDLLQIDIQFQSHKINNLSLLINHIQDIAGYSSVYDLLENDPDKQKKISETIQRSVSEQKRRMIESCFRTMCQPEMNSLFSMIKTHTENTDGISSIILDYVHYVPNKSITTLINTITELDSGYVCSYISPLSIALDKLRTTPSLDFIEMLRLLLDNGANLDAPRKRVVGRSSQTIRANHESYFPKDFFNQLLSTNRKSSSALLNEVIQFRAAPTSTRPITTTSRKCVIM